MKKVKILIVVFESNADESCNWDKKNKKFNTTLILAELPTS